jgi:hypothetical protein
MYEKRKLVLPLKKYKYFGTQRVNMLSILSLKLLLLIAEEE